MNSGNDDATRGGPRPDDAGPGQPSGSDAASEGAAQAHVHPLVADYANAVRHELRDLDTDELADVVEDLMAHLSDVVRELGVGATWQTLTDRLGAPAAYAAELRTSAGLRDAPSQAPAAAARPAGIGRRAVRFLAAVLAGAAVVAAAIGIVGVLFVDTSAIGWLSISLISSVSAFACILSLALRSPDRSAELRSIPGALYVIRAERAIRQRPWGEPAFVFVRSLRPAWWVARAALLGLVVAYAVTASLGLAVFLAGVVVSVWVGLRTTSDQTPRWPRAVVSVANVGVLAMTLAVALATANNHTTFPVEFMGNSDDEYWAAYDQGYEEAIEETAGYSADGHEGGYETGAVECVEEYDEGVDDLVEVCYDESGEPVSVGGEGIRPEAGPRGGRADVSNLFVYGPDGKLLTGVRVFDQDGMPLEAQARNCAKDARGQTFTEASPWGSNVYPRMSVVKRDGVCGKPRLAAPYGEKLPDLAKAESKDT